MKRHLLILATIFYSFISFSQDSQDCFTRLENAFKERGSLAISDGIHEEVYICFFEENETYCVEGKVRVENGTIVAIFPKFDDNSFETYNKKFYSASKKMPPIISNGISEMATTAEGEKFRVVFIKKLKPKKKAYKEISLPDDL